MNAPLAPGHRLGRYELLCPAGQGGMATVWLARLVGTRGFHKPVAIKLMLPSIREDPDAERMFQTEAALASRIHHPNVAGILDFGEENDALYIVMEWIHGNPLSQVIVAAGKRGGMPLGIAVRIVSQVSAGLHAAHELADDAGKALGVVHRDVSPQNVLLGFNGIVKLVDFGIAKVTAEATHLTEMGMVRGKVLYMAPEQIKLERLDRRADVFAAGILLYVLTTGRHPFKRDERADTALAICEDAPALSPRSFIPDYPERLERVVLKALAKKPEDRYRTAHELGEDLLRTMPPSRGAAQEELQKYMADLLPERLAHHQEWIRHALGVHGVSGAPVGTLPRTAHSSSTLRAVSVSDATSSGPARESAIPESGAATPDHPVAPTLRPRARPRTTVLALAAGAVAGAVVIAAITGSHRGSGAGAGGAEHAGAQPTESTVAEPAIATGEPPPASPTAVPDAGAPTRATPSSAERAPSEPKRAPKNAAHAVPRRGPKESAAPNQGTVLKDPYAR